MTLMSTNKPTIINRLTLLRGRMSSNDRYSPDIKLITETIAALTTGKQKIKALDSMMDEIQKQLRIIDEHEDIEQYRREVVWEMIMNIKKLGGK